MRQYYLIHSLTQILFKFHQCFSSAKNFVFCHKKVTISLKIFHSIFQQNDKNNCNSVAQIFFHKVMWSHVLDKILPIFKPLIFKYYFLMIEFDHVLRAAFSELK